VEHYGGAQSFAFCHVQCGNSTQKSEAGGAASLLSQTLGQIGYRDQLGSGMHGLIDRKRHFAL
jgi:hypothetical protein